MFGKKEIILLVIIGLLTWQCSSSRDDIVISDNAPSFLVAKGPLTISVLESGTIKAKEQVIIKNEVEGKTTILSLVKEGTPVQKGELLIELDASRLEDSKIDQQIRVQNGEAAYIRTRENFEVVKNQAQSEIEKAELAFQFAKEDLIKYENGEYPKDQKSANAKITVAKEELQRAEEKLKWSEKLFDEKYISLTELQADQLSAQKTKLDLELAVADRDLLQDYTYKRKMTELTSDVKQAEMALERTRRKASADIVQAEAEFRAKDSEFTREKSKLEKLNEQIAKTVIKAPIDGLVVYATSAQGNWRGNAEPLAEGQEIREQQELIHLPASGSVKAEAKIHESNLDNVAVGLSATVTVDALPGKTFFGKVDTIAPLPDAVSVWLNPDLKLYASDVLLEDGISGLRTGMSCQVEIIIERYDDVTYVPVQSVSMIDGQASVYVKSGRKWKATSIETGLDNNRMVHVISGLNENDEILLSPPLNQTKSSKKNGKSGSKK